MKRFILVAVVAALTTFFFYGCTDDNDEIRANSDDKFRYTHWSHESVKQEDDVKLHFDNLSTGESMTWSGGVRDALVYLEQLDKGKCYFNPVNKWEAEEVDCE